MIYSPLTKLQCCPTSDGAAAAIVVSEDFVRANGLENQAIEISAITMKSDFANTFGTSNIDLRWIMKIWNKISIKQEPSPIYKNLQINESVP